MNIYTTQWGNSPLFNLLLQTSPDAWGYDLSQGISTFAPADANGIPSVTILFVQIVQGALWIQEKSRPDCLTYYPTGSVVIESKGYIHNPPALADEAGDAAR